MLPAPATVARAITGAAGIGPAPLPGVDVGADVWTGADTVAITGWLPVTVPTVLGGVGAPATTGTVVNGATAADVSATDVPAAAVPAAGGVIRIVASDALDTGVGSGVLGPATGLGAGLGGAVGVGSGGFTPGAPVPATGVGTGRLTGAVAIAGVAGGRFTAAGPVAGPLAAIFSVVSAPDPCPSLAGPADSAPAAA